MATQLAIQQVRIKMSIVLTSVANPKRFDKDLFFYGDKDPDPGLLEEG